MTQQPHRIFVGIDVAADSFVASIYTGIDVTEAPRTAAFAGDQDGFEVFAEWLSACRAEPERTVLCLEDTGVYSEALCHDIYRRGLPLAVEDPLRAGARLQDVGEQDGPNRRAADRRVRLPLRGPIALLGASKGRRKSMCAFYCALGSSSRATSSRRRTC